MKSLNSGLNTKILAVAATATAAFALMTCDEREDIAEQEVIQSSQETHDKLNETLEEPKEEAEETNQ